MPSLIGCSFSVHPGVTPLLSLSWKALEHILSLRCNPCCLVRQRLSHDKSVQRRSFPLDINALICICSVKRGSGDHDIRAARAPQHLVPMNDFNETVRRGNEILPNLLLACLSNAHLRLQNSWQLAVQRSRSWENYGRVVA